MGSWLTLLALLAACEDPTWEQPAQPECLVDADCDDGNPCTRSACIRERCADDVMTGETCTTGDPCRVDKTCDAAGECSGGIPGPEGVACDDQDACTQGETCDLSGTCTNGQPVSYIEGPCEQCACHPVWGVECDFTPLEGDCACLVYGRIQFVDAFADLTVEIVDAFPDIEVEQVDAFADRAGEWEIVDSFPDYTVQIVDAFADITIEYVDVFPSCHLD